MMKKVEIDAPIGHLKVQRPPTNQPTRDWTLSCSGEHNTASANAVDDVLVDYKAPESIGQVPFELKEMRGPAAIAIVDHQPPGHFWAR